MEIGDRGFFIFLGGEFPMEPDGSNSNLDDGDEHRHTYMYENFWPAGLTAPLVLCAKK